MDNSKIDAKQKEEIRKQLEAEQKKFEDRIAEVTKELENSHIAKEYTFSIIEKRRLIQQQTIAFLVQQAVDDIINLTVLPRIGISPNPTIRVSYDVTLGKFVVFSPKPEAVPAVPPVALESTPEVTKPTES